MNNKRNKKSTYMFMGVAALAIVLLGIGWLYLSSQGTGVVLSSEQTVYFPNDKIKVEVSVENYGNANEASVVVNYPENALLVDSKGETGVVLRDLGNAVVFEADSSFLSAGNKKLGTIIFDSNGNGEFVFTIDKELTKLANAEGNMEIKKLVDLSVSVGVPSDKESDTKKSQGSSLEI